MHRHSCSFESNLNLKEHKKPETCNYPAWIRKPVYGTECENTRLNTEVTFPAVPECERVEVGSVKPNPNPRLDDGLRHLMMTDGVISEA